MCIERPGALIPGVNRTQSATMMSPDVYDSDVKVLKVFGIDTCFIQHYNSGKNFG